MQRSLSERNDTIAAFYEGIAAHLEDNDGVFFGGPVLSMAERKVIRGALKRMAEEHRDNAAHFRSEGR